MAAKYGGFDDNNRTGKPDQTGKWDKNGDGVPDTYYEANQGNQLQGALTSAFNDILTRVSSGTAASILNNSEGSGASLLQAVFYPKKTFDNGTEVTWVGELQNLWYYLDPFLQLSSIRVDTVSDYKLSLLDDYVAQFFFDTSTNQTLVRLLRDTTGKGTPWSTWVPTARTIPPTSRACGGQAACSGRGTWPATIAPFTPVPAWRHSIQ